MQGGEHATVGFGFTQVGIDQVDTFIVQPALFNQIILDRCSALLSQLAQQQLALRSGVQHRLAHVLLALLFVHFGPFGRWLLLEAGAIDAFEQGGLFVFSDR